ncbi:MAG TPA: hypothetical protein PKW35_19715 [Nannocystaceae bacterium]|nr:hypothetical protein [Nannocystaceae bacterium]
MPETDGLTELVILDGRRMGSSSPRVEAAATMKRPLRPAAALDGGAPLTAKELLEAPRSRGLALSTVIERLRQRSEIPLSGEAATASALTLSPQVPYVAGRGSLNFLYSWQVNAGAKCAIFSRLEGDTRPWHEFRTELWLQGLEAGANYLVLIRAMISAGSKMEISGTGLPGMTVTAGSTSTTIPALIQSSSPYGGLTIRSLDSAAWRFEEATIARV